MQKKWLAFVMTLFAFLSFSISVFAADIPPKPTNSIYVQDYAQVLTAEDKSKLNQWGKSLEAQTKAQIVVVTIKSLDGEAIENYALQLFRSWGIGDKEMNNGVLMLVSVEDRKSKIEVGYGLEGALPDGKTGEIQDKYMLPYFREGNYSTGILNGYASLLKVTANEYGVTFDGNAKPVQAKQTETSQGLGLTDYLMIAGLVILFIIDWMFFGGAITRMLLILLSRSRGGGGGGGSYGGGSSGGGGSSRNW